MTVSNDKQAVVQKVFTDFLVQHGHRKTPERMAQYERSYFFGQHDHIILTHTGKVVEFSDPLVDSVKKAIKEVFNNSIGKHSLYCYGTRNQLTSSFTKASGHYPLLAVI